MVGRHLEERVGRVQQAFREGTVARDLLRLGEGCVRTVLHRDLQCAFPRLTGLPLQRAPARAVLARQGARGHTGRLRAIQRNDDARKRLLARRIGRERHAREARHRGALRRIDDRLRLDGLASAAVRDHHARHRARLVAQDVGHVRARDERHAVREERAVERLLHHQRRGNATAHLVALRAERDLSEEHPLVPFPTERRKAHVADLRDLRVERRRPALVFHPARGLLERNRTRPGLAVRARDEARARHGEVVLALEAHELHGLHEPHLAEVGVDLHLRHVVLHRAADDVVDLAVGEDRAIFVEVRRDGGRVGLVGERHGGRAVEPQLLREFGVRLLAVLEAEPQRARDVLAQVRTRRDEIDVRPGRLRRKRGRDRARRPAHHEHVRLLHERNPPRRLLNEVAGKDLPEYDQSYCHQREGRAPARPRHTREGRAPARPPPQFPLRSRRSATLPFVHLHIAFHCLNSFHAIPAHSIRPDTANHQRLQSIPFAQDCYAHIPISARNSRRCAVAGPSNRVATTEDSGEGRAPARPQPQRPLRSRRSATLPLCANRPLPTKISNMPSTCGNPAADTRLAHKRNECDPA